ncbi:hypothetical protein OAA19_00805 [Rubripirellula sp.]|nr:hypothetical protein [Rubripirellula sp.]MDB4338626.1 hypothetical protein [Rubripirellula sp.]
MVWAFWGSEPWEMRLSAHFDRSGALTVTGSVGLNRVIESCPKQHLFVAATTVFTNGWLCAASEMNPASSA